MVIKSLSTCVQASARLPKCSFKEKFMFMCFDILAWIFSLTIGAYKDPGYSMVTWFCIVQLKASFETKAGPIQTVLVHDVTKLNSDDLVVGDSRGIVTVFSKGQILVRKVASEYCIHCLQAEKDASEWSQKVLIHVLQMINYQYGNVY